MSHSCRDSNMNVTFMSFGVLRGTGEGGTTGTKCTAGPGPSRRSFGGLGWPELGRPGLGRPELCLPELCLPELCLPELGLGEGTGGGAEPHVDGAWFGWVERAGDPGRVVLDPPHAEGVLVGESLRAEEVQEDRARLRVPTGA